MISLIYCLLRCCFLWITRFRLSCSIVSTNDKCIVWTNLNSSSLTSVAVLNSRFLMRLPTSREKDFQRVSVLKQDISRTACELTLNLSISCPSVCDLTDCYIFNYEIMPATLANTFLFILQGNALVHLGCSGKFLTYTWSQLISVCNN